MELKLSNMSDKEYESEEGYSKLITNNKDKIKEAIDRMHNQIDDEMEKTCIRIADDCENEFIKHCETKFSGKDSN